MNNCYCSIGHLSKKEDIETLNRMLLHNYSIISQFNYIVVHQNCSDVAEPYLSDYDAVWRTVFGKDVIILPPKKNRGHTIGYMDSDNAVVNYAKMLPINFIYKGVNDILLGDRLLKYPVTDEYDFYFLQAIGYSGLNKFDHNIQNYMANYMTDDYLYPQTNFYIIKNTVDYINNEKDVDDAYNYCNSVRNFNGKVWEYIPNFSCEKLLGKCVIRNKFKCKHLISDAAFNELLNLVENYKVCDCSHKNIFLEEIGVCHYHNINQECISI